MLSRELYLPVADRGWMKATFFTGEGNLGGSDLVIAYMVRASFTIPMGLERKLDLILAWSRMGNSISRWPDFFATVTLTSKLPRTFALRTHVSEWHFLDTTTSAGPLITLYMHTPRSFRLPHSFPFPGQVPLDFGSRLASSPVDADKLVGFSASPLPG